MRETEDALLFKAMQLTAELWFDPNLEPRIYGPAHTFDIGLHKAKGCLCLSTATRPERDIGSIPFIIQPLLFAC